MRSSSGRSTPSPTYSPIQGRSTARMSNSERSRAALASALSRSSSSTHALEAHLAAQQMGDLAPQLLPDKEKRVVVEEEVEALAGPQPARRHRGRRDDARREIGGAEIEGAGVLALAQRLGDRGLDVPAIGEDAVDQHGARVDRVREARARARPAHEKARVEHVLDPPERGGVGHLGGVGEAGGRHEPPGQVAPHQEHRHVPDRIGLEQLEPALTRQAHALDQVQKAQQLLAGHGRTLRLLRQ